jgi:hypothetical protein
MSGTDLALAVGALAGAGALAFAVWVAARTYLRFKGKAVVVCPENNQPAGVEVSALSAALTAVGGRLELRLDTCTRWPEKMGCGQECLASIQTSPESCLMRSILGDWYRDKTCTYCQRPFGEISWIDHEPALLTPDGAGLEWRDVPAEGLQGVLATHKPVCWNCHVAESFRREHPDLVTDRPR